MPSVGEDVPQRLHRMEQSTASNNSYSDHRGHTHHVKGTMEVSTT